MSNGPNTPSPTLPRFTGEGSVANLPSPAERGRVGEGVQPQAQSPRTRANTEQLQASNPAVSTFVAASAGSGKTKLLTDRLLRLMLSGAKPERIQCLTFTKAAAAEMSVRLQKTLGKWVTLDDALLSDELRALNVEPSRPNPGRPPVPCSQQCSTFPVACESAPSTRSASRCCAASRWKHRFPHTSAWSTIATPRTP